MFGLLFLLFIVVPIIELYVIVQVAGGLGIFPTLALLITISIVGAWLVRREGSGIVPRIREALFSGRLPSHEIADGGLIMLGGSLLLTPGFVTDLVGFGLLIPPIRAVVRGMVMKRYEARKSTAAEQVRSQFGVGSFGRTPPTGNPTRGNPTNPFRPPVIDVEEVTLRRTDNPAGSVTDRPGLETP